MYTKSFSQPTNPGSRQEGQGYKGDKRRNRGQGKPALKLPASFRLTDSCTFLLAPPRGSFSSPENIFLLRLTQIVFLDTFSSFYSLLQMAEPS